MTDNNETELSPDEQRTVDRFLQGFSAADAEAQARSFLALAHVVETLDHAPSLEEAPLPELDTAGPLEVDLEEQLAGLRKELASYAEIRGLSPSRAERDEDYRALERHGEELAMIAWDTSRADALERERNRPHGREGFRQRRMRVQRASLKGVRQIWNSFGRERHALIETSVRIYALAQPRTLEARLADDKRLQARASELQRAQEAFAEAKRVLDQHRLAHPLSHRWRKDTRSLEDAALQRAAALGVAEHVLKVERGQREALHARRFLMERGMRGQAAKALPRQHQLAMDPTRQLAFEAFCSDHQSVSLPNAAVGQDFIVAKIQKFQELPAFAVLATPKSRYGVDMRRYTFDAPPAVGTRLTLQSGQKLSSEASSTKALSADSSAIGFGR